MRKKTKMVLFFGIVVLVFASLSAAMWSPWLSDDIAKKKAVSYFAKGWEQVSDGCYLTCEDCGVIGIKKVFFGKLVSLQYKCGWAGDVITDRTSDIFINFLGRTNYDIDQELQ